MENPLKCSIIPIIKDNIQGRVCDMNKQQLAAKIWNSANKMRSKIEANEYKDYILGFIFYKYLSEREVKYLSKSLFMTPDNIAMYANEENGKVVSAVQDDLGYFISYDNLFSTWLSKGKNFSVSDVHDALSAFSRLIGSGHKRVFDGIFKTLETGLSKLGDSSGSQTKAISDLIYLINDIPMDGKQDYDVLGFIYEYLIGNFAANAGKKAGEFYTPHEVSVLMSEIVAEHLKDRSEITIYDPTSGSGSLLINIGKSISRYIGASDCIQYCAQELKENTYNLTRMNLVMRGIKASNIVTRNGDTLEEDWPYFDPKDPLSTYRPLYVDAVVSNPPYSQQWNPEGKENDARFRNYGLAPKSKADYAFLLHDLFHLKDDGIMTIVLPHGVLFRGGEEGSIRRNLIEKNNIDTIIGLPANIFFGTGIPTIIMVLKKDRTDSDVLIVDASKGFEKAGTSNRLRASDIKRIVDTVVSRRTVDKYSKLVSRDEIRDNDYNLNIPRYVDSSEPTESWDIYSLMFGGIPNSELSSFDSFWNAFPSLRNELFKPVSSDYSELAVKDVKTAVLNNSNVSEFRSSYLKSFESFGEYLSQKLIKGLSSIDSNRAESQITEEVFSRLEQVPLVDRYDVYQALDNQWLTISQDLETIHTEGQNCISKVVPLMVAKKKDGKEQEVQEGWQGLILPFELVQKVMLNDKLEAIKAVECELSSTVSGVDEIIESLSEEEKSDNKSSEGQVLLLNEEGDAFVPAVLSKKAKELSKLGPFEEDSFESKILNAYELMEKAKGLRSSLKSKGNDLTKATMEVFEKLSNDDALLLLEMKWVDPLVEKIEAIPDSILSSFVSRISALSKKYESTFADISNEIEETESKLSAMLDDLVGSEYDMKGLEEFKKLLRG